LITENEIFPTPDFHVGDEDRKKYPMKWWLGELAGEYIPSQSSSDGESTLAHSTRTESPDLFSVVGVKDMVAAAAAPETYTRREKTGKIDRRIMAAFWGFWVLGISQMMEEGWIKLGVFKVGENFCGDF